MLKLKKLNRRHQICMIARPAGSMLSHVLLEPRLCCDLQVKQKNVAFTLEEITHHGFTSRF
jgi:hypothetical protein